ncbi:MAG: hypothetical protein R2827_07495 [Bdellovibrionales bacterium]
MSQLIVIILSVVFLHKNTFAGIPLVTRGFYDSDDFSTEISKQFNSEVESDYLTYSPVNCDYQYLINQNPSAVCTSIGSLSKTRFFVDQNFLFMGNITSDIEFRTQINKKQSYEMNSTGTMVEFIGKLKEGHFFGLHGDYDANKSNDDIGLSYEFIGSKNTLHIQTTFHDFTRNTRNENQDSFQIAPITYALSFLNRNDKAMSFLRIIGEPYWKWSQLSGITTRERNSIEGFHKNNNSFMSFYLSNDDLETGPTEFQKMSVLRTHYEKNAEWGTLGVRYVEKAWKNSNGRLRHHDALPFVWLPWVLPWREWNLGFEATWHRSIGDKTLMASEDPRNALELRSNVAWSIFSSNTTLFRLLFTFDLDSLTTGEGWEGGSGQFVMFF